MRVQIVTDSWPPVVSGVVRTYQTTISYLELFGHDVHVIHPLMFWNVPFPSDTHMRLALTTSGTMGRMIEKFRPDAIHIASEGTLGLAARNWCVKRKIPFTTSYTTKLPEYMQARTGVPAGFGYPIMRWFHGPSAAVMASTDTLKRELESHGFTNIVRWSRGVDAELFRPREKDFLDAPRPIFMYSGRVAREKNIEAFLNLNLAGTKYVVGDGPQLAQLTKAYPQVRFVGNKHGVDLARHYAAADVFVFPSKTDTFGLVLLEAMASGVPVAAYPVPGPNDVVGNSGAGALHENLETAARQALAISPELCREYALQFDWAKVAKQFISNQRPIEWRTAKPNFFKRRRVVDAKLEQN
ncbi:MAG: glycosyltransferase family 4 protein [Pirellulales bacterium]